MPTPHLYFGQHTESMLLELDGDTFMDAGVSYNLRAKTNRVAPADTGGECIFTAVYLTTTHVAASHLFMTPLVDGLPLETQRIDLTDPLGIETTLVHELGLSVPLVIATIERARFAPRGTWFQALVHTEFDGVTRMASKLVIESIEVEREIVRESKQAAGVTT